MPHLQFKSQKSGIYYTHTKVLSKNLKLFSCDLLALLSGCLLLHTVFLQKIIFDKTAITFYNGRTAPGPTIASILCVCAG